VRCRFEHPVRASGRAEGDGFLLQVDAEDLTGFFLQLSFSSERAEAANLAHRARQAEAEQNCGESLTIWQELLDRYPYESALVEEAETSRSRLIQQGLQELRTLRARVEEASFFRLAGLFQETGEALASLSARYANSEVAAEAAALVGEIDQARAALEREREDREIERLEAILGFLQQEQSEGLAAAVSEFIAERRRPETP
jgi:hypothetical protein